MQTREGRIIIAGMLLGALGGGIAIMLLRMRAARESQTEPEAFSAMLKHISWPEVISIGVAGVALARRIGGLIDRPEESETQ